MTRRGFSLVDALAAVMLTAILARESTLAATALAASLRVGATTRMLAQTMRETRAHAMAEGLALDVVFDATSSLWTVRTPAGAARRTESLPSPVHFVSLPATARIRFGSTGAAENGTIVLGAGSTTGRIIVNQRGRVRLG